MFFFNYQNFQNGWPRNRVLAKLELKTTSKIRKIIKNYIKKSNHF